MKQSSPDRPQSADRSVQLAGLVREPAPVDARPSVRPEHARDLVKGEAGAASQRDQGQPFQHAGIEEPAQAPPASRGDQPFLFIEPQRRRRHSGAPDHLGDIQNNPLDLKST